MSADERGVTPRQYQSFAAVLACTAKDTGSRSGTANRAVAIASPNLVRRRELTPGTASFRTRARVQATRHARETERSLGERVALRTARRDARDLGIALVKEPTREPALDEHLV
jgi:hypothetical protein